MSEANEEDRYLPNAKRWVRLSPCERSEEDSVTQPGQKLAGVIQHLRRPAPGLYVLTPVVNGEAVLAQQLLHVEGIQSTLCIGMRKH